MAEDVAALARQAHGERLIEWIHIPALQLNAPVAPVGWSAEDLAAGEVNWQSPEAAVGWAVSSALPGDEQGNVLLYGHNNIHSSVFRDLANLQPGDEVRLTTGQREWVYRVSEVHILPGSSAASRYLRPASMPHLVLVSCWPPDNNTHRVIVIAQPAAE